MNMPKSRDIQAKMSSPKVILNTFWLVTVKVLNSYNKINITNEMFRKKCWQKKLLALLFSVYKGKRRMPLERGIRPCVRKM